VHSTNKSVVPLLQNVVTFVTDVANESEIVNDSSTEKKNIETTFSYSCCSDRAPRSKARVEGPIQ
jgi:hypothetical protein